MEKFMVWCGEDTCAYGIWGMYFVHSYGVTGVCSTHSEDVADLVFILSIFTIIFLEGETGLVAPARYLPFRGIVSFGGSTG